MIVLRPGNAGANTATNRVETIRRVLDQGGLGPPGWPGCGPTMCRELPRQGAQLRLEKVGGYRPVALVSNTRVGRLADLEVRRQLRERCLGPHQVRESAPARFALKREVPSVGLDRFALQGCAVNASGAFSWPWSAGLLALSQMLTLAGAPPGAGNPRRYACD